jgi:AhpD family alkylhydroperoxidase
MTTAHLADAVSALAPRIDLARAAPEFVRAHLALESYVRASGLESSLLHLIKLRASYLNGCAYCVDMHTKDARLENETEQRLYAIPVWHETPYFTPRERAALALTDAVTEIGRTHAPDDVFEALREHFTDEEITNLTAAIVVINGWNRLAISMRTPVGSYVPRGRHQSGAAA